MMPVNAKLALDHRLGGWTNSVELQLVGSKDQVSQVHNELTTPDYALVNLRTGYQWQAVRVDLGVDNLFNQNYYLPLGGADLVDYKVVSMMGSSAAYGYNVKGPGRSFNGRLTVKFLATRSPTLHHAGPGVAEPPRHTRITPWSAQTWRWISEREVTTPAG